MGFDVDTLAEKPLRRWNEKDTVRGDDDVCAVAVTGGTRLLGDFYSTKAKRSGSKRTMRGKGQKEIHNNE